MKTLNLQIFSENKDLYDDVIDLLCRRDKKFCRDLSIEKILYENDSKKDRQNVFYFDSLFGEIYENDKVTDISLNKSTHVIKSIDLNQDNIIFTAEVIILDTPTGRPAQLYPEESLRLRPVYHSYTNELITFNIEMITINEAA